MFIYYIYESMPGRSGKIVASIVPGILLWKKGGNTGNMIPGTGHFDAIYRRCVILTQFC